LKGRALDVYPLLAPEESKGNVKLKQALLRRYQLTIEGFRKIFRTCLPEKGQTTSEFSVRLDRYLS